MLDLWIIEELKRKEAEKREREAHYVELPLPVYEDPREDLKPTEVEESPRGVVIIDL